MIPCISQVTTLPAPFDDDIRAAAGAKCDAVEVWLTKLETYLTDHSVDTAKQLVVESGVKLVAAAGQGGILLSQGESRREAFALFDRRLELCEVLGIPTMVVTGDFTGAITAVEVERAILSLKQAGQLAARHGVWIAFEFQSRFALCNNLHTAATLVEQCREPNVGICLDVFHYYTGPSKFEDLAALPANRICHVQLSDLAGTPRELATDSDRVLPGDGDFQFGPIIDHLRSVDYRGAVSVELMNPQIWQIAPVQVAEVAVTALRRVLGLAVP